MTYTILFVGTYPNLGIGYSKVANLITNALAEQESTRVVHFGFSNFPGNKKVERYVNPNISIIDVVAREQQEYPALNELYGINIFIDTLEQVKPDLVFFYNDVLVISRLMNKLIEYRKIRPQTFKVLTYLDLVYDYERPEYLAHVYNNSDKVILFSDYWLKHMVSMKFPASKLTVLYHSYDHTKFSPMEVTEAKRIIGLRDDSFVLLNANRNSYRKGTDITIAAFLIFLKQEAYNPRLGLFLHCAFDSTCGYNIENTVLTECLKLNMDYDRVINNHIFKVNGPNEVSDETMNALYNACDVGLNTCIGEGFGLCNMEHGILGKPQIVSKVGGLSDIFADLTPTTLIAPKASYQVSNHTDGHNGVAYVCDATDIAHSLKEIFYNYDLYKRQFEEFGVGARKKYAMAAVKEQLYNIMASVQ